MDSVNSPALLGAALLALVHLAAGRLRFLNVIPRSRWLSYGSGVSVAYAFLHLLPELTEERRTVVRSMEQTMEATIGLSHYPVYVVVTTGLAAFYGLERLAERSREEHRQEHGEDRTRGGVFWVHTAFFGIYNVLIGYVLVERASDTAPFILFVIAMALHFVVNDYGLRQHHKELYGRRGRWILAGAVLLGWLAGRLLMLPGIWHMVPMAFIAGGVILNVLKEELPRERESRFWAFALGVVSYGALLLAI